MYWVVDRPEYAPAMRAILHRIRAAVLGGALSRVREFDIHDRPPRGSEFQSLLTNPAFKQKLLEALAESLCHLGDRLSQDQRIVVDSPGLDVPVAVTATSAPVDMPELAHKLGDEADYAIWHHVKHSGPGNILVCAGDTDIFMTGLALQSLGALGDGKDIMIERRRDEDYLKVSETMRSIERQYKEVIAMFAMQCN